MLFFGVYDQSRIPRTAVENGLKSATPRLPPLIYGWTVHKDEQQFEVMSTVRIPPFAQRVLANSTIRVGMGDSLQTTNLTAVRFNCPIRPVIPIRFSLTTRSLQRLFLPQVAMLRVSPLGWIPECVLGQTRWTGHVGVCPSPYCRVAISALPAWRIACAQA